MKSTLRNLAVSPAPERCAGKRATLRRGVIGSCVAVLAAFVFTVGPASGITTTRAPGDAEWISTMTAFADSVAPLSSQADGDHGAVYRASLAVSGGQTVEIPAQANIFGAGHSVLPAAGGGAGVAPPRVDLPAGSGRSVTVSNVTGTANPGCGGPDNGPDGLHGGGGGCRGTDINAVGGIAGIVDSQAHMMLVGLFLTDTEPADPAPERLNFSPPPAGIGEDYERIAPEIRQVFYIGDGLRGTGTGSPQEIVVPDGATRLFLGIADAFGFIGAPGWYGDNTGSFTATVAVGNASPPPARAGRIVYSLETATTVSDIWSIKPDGTDPVNVTKSDRLGARAPDLSPDGTKIAFAATGSVGTRDVHVINADGTGLRNLTSAFTAIVATWDPSWSPDGTKIAFRGSLLDATGVLPKPEGDVYVVNADGTGLMRLTTSEDVRDIAWSPVDDRIAFTRNDRALYTIKSDGSELPKLVFSPPGFTGPAREPAWSPDGTKLAFEYHGPTGGCGSAITTLKSNDGSDVRHLTSVTCLSGTFGPSWSPDGTQIVVSRFVTAHREELFLMSATTGDTGGITRVTTTPDPFREQEPDWGSEAAAPAPAATQTALTSSANPSVSGQRVTYTATVTSDAGTPSGTVKFTDGATAIPGCSSQPLSGGVATCEVTYASPGTHSIRAAYTPNTSDLQASSSPVLTQTVNKAATTTSLGVSPNPAAPSQEVTLTATVSANAPGSGTPTGTVTFLDGTTALGTGTLDGSGRATLRTSSVAPGTHSLTASYAGDTSYLASTSTSASLVVGAVPGAPTGVGATADDGSATVTWSAPANDGGSPITGYVVTPYVGATAQTPITVANVTSTIVSGLTNGTTYTFKVAARNAIGTGPESAASNAVIPSRAAGVTPVPGKIAYILGGNVWTINSDGIGAFNVTQNAALDARTPAFSPDGTQIAFVSSADDDLYVINADGTGLMNLTSSHAVLTNTWDPSWSPDGTKLAFEGRRDDFTTRDVYILEGTTLTRVTTLGDVQWSDWSPVDDRIAFSRRENSIWTVRANGTGLQQLTSVSGNDGWHWAPAWSPDGTKISFNIYGGGSGDIVTVSSADGGNRTLLTPSGDYSAADPSWSPDGTQIVFSGTVEEPITRNADLYVMSSTGEADGFARVTNTSDFTAREREPDWWGAATRTTAGTRTSVVSSSNPSVTGQTVTYTASVRSGFGYATPLSTGSVSFSDGGTPIAGCGSRPLVGGQATCSVTYGATGTHSVTAAFTPATPDYAASSTSPLTQTVTRAATAITLAVSPASVPYGETLTLTAAVGVTPPGSGTPSGSVVFVVGDAFLAQSGLDGSGRATLSTAALPSGTHNLTAVYGGDGNYFGATSTSVTVTVLAPPPPPAAPSVPAAPAGVTARAGNASATVSWSPPAGDGGSAVTGYVVTPYVRGVAQPPTPVGTVTSTTVAVLRNGTTYTFTVAARNAVGTGPESAPSNAVTPTAPNRPPAARRCVVPSVLRRLLATAKAAIRRASCSVGTVTFVATRNKASRGRVLRQRPAPGTKLRAGAKVNLTVGRGSR